MELIKTLNKNTPYLLNGTEEVDIRLVGGSRIQFKSNSLVGRSIFNNFLQEGGNDKSNKYLIVTNHINAIRNMRDTIYSILRSSLKEKGIIIPNKTDVITFINNNNKDENVKRFTNEYAKYIELYYDVNNKLDKYKENQKKLLSNEEIFNFYNVSSGIIIKFLNKKYKLDENQNVSIERLKKNIIKITINKIDYRKVPEDFKGPKNLYFYLVLKYHFNKKNMKDVPKEIEKIFEESVELFKFKDKIVPFGIKSDSETEKLYNEIQNYNISAQTIIKFFEKLNDTDKYKDINKFEDVKYKISGNNFDYVNFDTTEEDNTITIEDIPSNFEGHRNLYFYFLFNYLLFTGENIENIPNNIEEILKESVELFKFKDKN